MFWRESGRRKAKALPTKDLAEHFSRIKYQQINSDVFVGVVGNLWPDMVAEYLRHYDVQRKSEGAKYESLLTLRHFERIMGALESKYITQRALDNFILERAKEKSGAEPISAYTLNKDIRNLGAFIRWCQDRRRRYLPKDLELVRIKVQPREPRPLTSEEVHRLLVSARARSECWHMRVLLLASTGLRAGDVESLTVADIDFEHGTIRTTSRKTRKNMLARPLPARTATILAGYVAELPPGRSRLLEADSNTHKKWDVIRKRAGLPECRLQDLRVTFNSALAQAGVELTTRQRLLEHSDPRLTSNTYTGVDSVLGAAVNRLPVSDWLE